MKLFVCVCVHDRDVQGAARSKLVFCFLQCLFLVKLRVVEFGKGKVFFFGRIMIQAHAWQIEEG